MKRILTLLVLFVCLLSTVLASAAHQIEVRPFAKTSLLTLSDFKSAQVLGEGDNAMLSIELTNSAARRLSEFTKHHLGQELPVLVDGKLVSAPVVRAPIKGAAFQVGPMARVQADEIAQLVKEADSQHLKQKNQ